MANVLQERRFPGIFQDKKSREEVMREIQENPAVYSKFLDLNNDFRERFVQFCMGVRGVQMTYDSFFKKIFNAEAHPERLSRLLSEILGRPLKVRRTLPNDRSRITDRGSLLTMDILVEFETGELADVEIQKIGYLFPGQRASCYSSDMVMRQYERMKGMRGDDFTYKDLQRVYTIVFMEQSSRELKSVPEAYIHRGRWEFDTEIRMELLQEFYFLSLDNFLKIEDNKGKGSEMSELEAWLYFIGSDRVEHIYKVLESHPWFEEMYQEINDFRKHPEEAIGMFSDALRILDRNTVRYMIDEMKDEMKELEGTVEEQQGTIKKLEGTVEEREGTIKELEGTIEKQQKKIAALMKMVKGVDGKLDMY